MKNRIIHFSVITVGILMVFVGISSVIGADTENVSANDGPLQVLKTFTVGGGTGFFDYLKVDSGTNRLFISHSTQVEVIDANDGTRIDTITDTPGIHGIAFVPDSNEVYTTNGRENKLGVFDIDTLKPLRKVNTGQNPDAIIYDPATKKVFSFNHSGGNITVVDVTDTDKEPVTIQVGGELESGVSDLAGHVYVNVEDKSEVAVIDSEEDKVLDRWPLAPGEEPTGIAIDLENGWLFVGCGNQKMIILDADDGNVLASLSIGSGCDGITFEPSLGLVVTSNGDDGTATVIKEESHGTFKVVQTLRTVRGARTITSDPKTHLIYLPCNISTNGQNQFSVLVVGAKETDSEGTVVVAPVAPEGGVPLEGESADSAESAESGGPEGATGGPQGEVSDVFTAEKIEATAGISGKWSLTMKSPMGGDETFTLAIAANGETLTITCSDHPVLTNLEGTGTLKSDAITLNLKATGNMSVEINFTGTVAGNKMTGTREIVVAQGGDPGGALLSDVSESGTD